MGSKQHQGNRTALEVRVQTLDDRVLVVNSSPLHGQLIARRLEKMNVDCVCCPTSRAARELLVSDNAFTMTIVYHYYCGDNAFELVAEIKNNYPDMYIVAADFTAASEEHEKLFILGADRCIVMPFPLARFILIVTETMKGNGYHDVITMIPEFLVSCGFKRNLKGFDYLVYAVEVCVLDPERLTNLVTGLYPEIASHFCTDWKIIERSMRNLAKKAYENGAFYRMTDGDFRGKPTNYEMICAVCDAFSLRYDIF